MSFVGEFIWSSCYIEAEVTSARISSLVKNLVLYRSVFTEFLFLWDYLKLLQLFLQAADCTALGIVGWSKAWTLCDLSDGSLIPAYCRLMFTYSPMRQIEWRVSSNLSFGRPDSPHIWRVMEKNETFLNSKDCIYKDKNSDKRKSFM